MALRVNKGTVRRAPIEISFDGRTLAAYPGETIAAALLADGIYGFRRDANGSLRGPYCNMGTCFECLVEIQAVDGPTMGQQGGEVGQGEWRRVQACLTSVSAGLKVRTVSVRDSNNTK